MSKPLKLNRDRALKILLSATDKDDPHWDYLTEEFYDEEEDTWPSLFDVMAELGVPKKEVDRIIKTPMRDLGD